MKYKFLLFALGLALFLVLSLPVVWAFKTGVHFFRARKAAIALQASVFTQSGDADPEVLKGHLSDLNTHLHAMDRTVSPVLTVSEKLPIVATHANQYAGLLEYSLLLSDISIIVTNVFEPLWTFEDWGDLPVSYRLLSVLNNDQDKLQEASALMDQASELRQTLDADYVPGKFEEEYTLIEDNYHYLVAGVELLNELPAVMGLDAPRIYLLVAQNRDELRATGGFISAVGTVVVENGQIIQFEMVDSYAVDDYSKEYPPAPKALEVYMSAGYWVVRDANWSPDFPTSAGDIAELYELSTGVENDGVIAFDQSLITDLVTAMGPVVLESYPDPITEYNLEYYMHQSWNPTSEEGLSQEWWENRKNFISLLGQGLLAQTQATSDPESLLNIASLLMEAGQEGHLLLHFFDTATQQILYDTGLDGRIDAGDSDYVLVVDSNIGFNKVDEVVERSIDYYVDLTDPANPSALLISHYRHLVEDEDVVCTHQPVYGEEYVDMRQRCYWNYWRVYKHRNTALVRSEAYWVPASWLMAGVDWKNEIIVNPGEGGTKSFEGVMVLPTNETQDVALQFVLPSDVVSKNDDGLVYTLRIDKQHGLEALPVNVTVFTVPGYMFEGGSDGWVGDEIGQAWTWQSVIVKGVELKLILQEQ